MRAGTSSRQARGFTLIEVIVTTVLLGILFAVAAEPLLQGMKARAQVTSDLDAIGKMRYAMERIVRELRQTQYDTSSGFYLSAINGSGSSSTGICFTRVGGSAGTTNTVVAIKLTSTTVTYDNPTSCASLSTSPSTLVDNVSTLTFAYYGIGTGSSPVSVTTTDSAFATSINFIDVTLTITQDGQSLSQKVRVMLRNGTWA